MSHKPPFPHLTTNDLENTAREFGTTHPREVTEGDMLFGQFHARMIDGATYARRMIALMEQITGQTFPPDALSMTADAYEEAAREFRRMEREAGGGVDLVYGPPIGSA
jgi:hypothetical protein